MKTIIFPLVLALLLLSAGAVEAQSGRKTGPGRTGKPGTGSQVTSAENNFRCVFPGGFEQPKREESSTGKVTAFSSVSPSGPACTLAVRTFDKTELGNATPDQIMDAARNALLPRYKGTIDQEDPYVVQGYPARAVFFTGTADEKTVFGRVDFVVVKMRFYQLAYTSPNYNDLDRDDVQGFFESFTLVNVEPGPLAKPEEKPADAPPPNGR
jgi:hypothetical protein